MSHPKPKSTPAKMHLSSDPVLKLVIEKIPDPEWVESGNLFQEIVENILGQQLGNPSARTIIGRFKNLFKTKPFPTPQEILAMPDEKIRTCGTSWAKIKYIKNFSEAVASGTLDLEKIKLSPDEEVIVELTKVKGIGRWTAEMVLIFYLQRPDVFSLGDLGLRTAVSKLYKVNRDNIKKIEKISQRWSPHRSLASRYLWDSLDGKLEIF